MPDGPIAAVMIHVSDIEKGLAWYEEAFPQARRTCEAESDFEYLSVGDVHVEIVPSDEKVQAGAAGSVVYWHVDSLQSAIGRFARLGATLYRGPLKIGDALGICQVQDPWGNCIGLRGFYP